MPLPYNCAKLERCNNHFFFFDRVLFRFFGCCGASEVELPLTISELWLELVQFLVLVLSSLILEGGALGFLASRGTGLFTTFLLPGDTAFRALIPPGLPLTLGGGGGRRTLAGFCLCKETV